MPLTDEQRALIHAANGTFGVVDISLRDERIFFAGIAWGAADMRERAAKEAETVLADKQHKCASDAIPGFIRALPGEAP